MASVFRPLLPVLFIATLAACTQSPALQRMTLTSENQHALTLGIGGADRTASIVNDDFFNTDNQSGREPIASHFFDPDTEQCVNVGGPDGPPSLVFPTRLFSLEHGSAIVSGFENNSFPNTANALAALRGRTGAAVLDILVTFAPVTLRQGALTLDAEHTVGAVYDPNPGSSIVFSIVGMPGQDGPVAIAQTPMRAAKVKYVFDAPEECIGERIVSYPFEGTLDPLSAIGGTTDAGIGAVGIGLIADTQGKRISYCMIVPDHVGQLIGDRTHIPYALGVPGPWGNVPIARADISTGPRDCPTL